MCFDKKWLKRAHLTYVIITGFVSKLLLNEFSKWYNKLDSVKNVNYCKIQAPYANLLDTLSATFGRHSPVRFES